MVCVLVMIEAMLVALLVAVALLIVNAAALALADCAGVNAAVAALTAGGSCRVAREPADIRRVSNALAEASAAAAAVSAWVPNAPEEIGAVEPVEVMTVPCVRLTFSPVEPVSTIGVGLLVVGLFVVEVPPVDVLGVTVTTGVPPVVGAITEDCVATMDAAATCCGLSFTVDTRTVESAVCCWACC